MKNTLITNFKAAYADTSQLVPGRLAELYSEDIEFRDPVHRVSGLPALQAYMQNVMSNVDECRFEYLDELIDNGSAYIKWNMHFRHRQLAGGRRITVRGASQIQFGDQIHYHEDIYDLGAMIYEHIPLLGLITRYLKRRLQQ